MGISRGKKFEAKFKEDWEKSVPTSKLCYRIPDQQSRYKGASSNICDFLCFANKKLFLIECKSHQGTTFPFSCLKQYETMLSYSNIDDIVVGVVLWFVDYDKVIFAPIEEIIKMKTNNKKSINIKMLEENEYKLIEIPSSKKRVYLDSDYSILVKGVINDD